MQVSPAFQIGEHVVFIAGQDIDGIVTSYLLKKAASGWVIAYEVNWFANGDAKSKWAIAEELRTRERR